jgi:hypothetical protein
MEEQQAVAPEQVGLFPLEDYDAPIEIPDDEVLQDVALNAIGKIPLQDFINDAVSALVEIYKVKPEIFQLDVDNYDNYPPLIANPFIDLVNYLKEVRRETGTSNGAA